ncbi:4Fe-4S binding protein [bacterium]|jgi:NADH-quinone oxidoreductase subunit I|nr:4Fe-4S binding protein [bacterium]MBT3849870.1 4Fe-4S binding protein [bacterium]
MNILKICKNIYRNLKFTLSNVSKPAVTINYPDEQRTLPDKLRLGTFGLTSDKETGDENCIACKLCERICPSQIIDIEIEKRDGRGWAKKFNLDLQSCIQCELCVQVCPVDAIIMMRTPEKPTTSRADLYLTKNKMMRNAEKYGGAWATGSLLQSSHEPSKEKLDD